MDLALANSILGLIDKHGPVVMTILILGVLIYKKVLIFKKDADAMIALERKASDRVLAETDKSLAREREWRADIDRQRRQERADRLKAELRLESAISLVTETTEGLRVAQVDYRDAITTAQTLAVMKTKGPE
jgi:hypothetical protein